MPEVQNEKTSEYIPDQNNQTATALQERLNVDKVLYVLECNLRGQKVTEFVTNDGKLRKSVTKLGNPMLNEDGIKNVMSFVNCSINSMNIQGNTKQDYYNKIIAHTRLHLAKMIITNRINWDIKETETSNIINMVMLSIKLTISRTIDNLERDSYGMRVVDSRSYTKGSSFSFTNPFSKNSQQT